MPSTCGALTRDTLALMLKGRITDMQMLVGFFVCCNCQIHIMKRVSWGLRAGFHKVQNISWKVPSTLNFHWVPPKFCSRWSNNPNSVFCGQQSMTLHQCWLLNIYDNTHGSTELAETFLCSRSVGPSHSLSLSTLSTWWATSIAGHQCWTGATPKGRHGRRVPHRRFSALWAVFEREAEL